jgi:thiamine biosynthesis protein ThiI
MDFPIVLARFGEIGLKSKRTRLGLRGMLRRNILTQLKAIGLSPDRIEDTWERLILYTSQSENVAGALSKVFGVVSTSPALECSVHINKIVRVVCDLAREKLGQGETFAIRVRRIGKHEFTSSQLAAIIGSSVIETLKKNGIEVSVDLDSGDNEFFIEIRQDRCFVYHKVIRGVGGLPFGSQGRIVSRLTDYDGIVATWLMMKRGCAPTLMVFNQGKETKELIEIATSTLLPYSVGALPVIRMDLSNMVEETSLVLKESLEYMALSEIALLEGANGIVTADRPKPSDNEQMETIKTDGCIADCPVFYPLVGFDDGYAKQLAERIGGEKLAVKVGVSKRGVTGSHVREARTSTNLKVEGYREAIKKMVLEAKRNSLAT